MKEKVNIISFGSGSTGNSMYIEIGDHKILVDMGIGVKRIKDGLTKHNRNFSDIEAIFVTHSHYDHIKNAPAIVKRANAQVYCNRDTAISMMKKNIDYKIIELQKKIEVTPGLFVQAFKVPHDTTNYGYRFRVNDTTVAYCTDCGEMTKEIFNYLREADVVVLESNHDLNKLINGSYDVELVSRIVSSDGHLSNKECAENIVKLYDLGTRNFLLAHLSRENNTPELALKETLNALGDRKANIYVCPVEGDELLEMNKNELPKHSGFENPAIGLTLPKGTEIKYREDGTCYAVEPNQLFKQIKFSHNMYLDFDQNLDIEIVIEDGKIYSKYSSFMMPKIDINNPRTYGGYIELSKDKVEKIYKLLAECNYVSWKEEYEPVGYAVFDGFSWDLKVKNSINFVGTKKKNLKIRGSNAYPKEFCSLIKALIIACPDAKKVLNKYTRECKRIY